VKLPHVSAGGEKSGDVLDDILAGPASRAEQAEENRGDDPVDR